MGSDENSMRITDASVNISIHAPRMGSDPLVNVKNLLFHRFQSTLPAWGATFHRGYADGKTDISIHAPRMGSDIQKGLIT